MKTAIKWIQTSLEFSRFTFDAPPASRSGKAQKFALHHGKMSTTKRRAIQILRTSTFMFTYKCGYNNFTSKYTDINSLHVTQIDLLHNDTFCSTQFARFACKKGFLRVNSVMILVLLSNWQAQLRGGAGIGKRENWFSSSWDNQGQQNHF